MSGAPQSRWFGNSHSNCIGTHDARCTVTGLQPWKLPPQRFICQGAHYSTTCQFGVDTYPLVEPHYRHNRRSHILEDYMENVDVDPTCRFVASPEVGPGATVGTL
jgi:hypothetical protein